MLTIIDVLTTELVQFECNEAPVIYMFDGKKLFFRNPGQEKWVESELSIKELLKRTFKIYREGEKEC